MVQFEIKEYNYLIHTISRCFLCIKMLFYYSSYLNVTRAKFSQFSSELTENLDLKFIKTFFFIMNKSNASVSGYPIYQRVRYQ